MVLPHPRMDPSKPLATELMWGQRTPCPAWPTWSPASPSQASQPSRSRNRAGNPKWSLSTGVALGLGAHIRCRAHKHNRDLSPLPLPSDSWALVTGAASGLGQKLATACAEAGVSFGLWGSDCYQFTMPCSGLAGVAPADSLSYRHVTETGCRCLVRSVVAVHYTVHEL